MTRWTAIVPIKEPQQRKTRLPMSLRARAQLSDAMFSHVIGVLDASPKIERVVLLSAAPHPGRDWIEDKGRGLNPELEQARASLPGRALLVVHADLPELEVADIDALLEAAEGGAIALAPDRHGRGTNAVALPSGQDFDFAFGPDSLARHLAAAPRSTLVERRGLSRDVDTAEDLADWKSGRG